MTHNHHRVELDAPGTYPPKSISRSDVIGCVYVYMLQDDMFENTDGRLRYAGNSPQQLWPGEAKPGRWMSAVSRMGAVLKVCGQAGSGA